MYERIKALKSNYPAATIFALRNLGRNSDAENYIKICRKYDTGINCKNPETFSKYIHGYVLPKLEEDREKGNTYQGNL